MKKAVKKALEKIRKTHGKALKRLAENDTMSKMDIALHLREQTKRTDLPNDVIRAMANAYNEITRLEEENKELESLLDDYRRESMDRNRYEGLMED